MDYEERQRELDAAYNTAVEERDKALDEFEALPDDAPADDVKSKREEWRAAQDEVEHRAQLRDDNAAAKRARDQHQPVKVDAAASESVEIHVDEPDMYTKRGPRRFLDDLFAWHVRKDYAAGQRLNAHQELELQRLSERTDFDRGGWEERAMTSSTFGGLIPPVYLLDLYAKASRNGRVFIDQVNGQELPEYGMSLIIPRLTTPTAVGAQATENTTVTTQDMAETDLTIPVRTVAGYVPVSRQGLERAQYNEQILFEDLIARYWAKLDSSAIADDGTSGTFTGVNHTTGIVSSTCTGGNLIECWPNIHDVIQQITTNVGGLGFVPDRMVMHPRRWGIFAATKDTANRPLLGINGMPNFNAPGQGDAAVYGYKGDLAGLPVYVDANIPTNLGTNSDEDIIIIYPQQLPLIWERPNDPVTLAFEQTAGDSLTVHLIVYGYAAFSAGRYPSGVGVVRGLRTGGFS
jgi:HK97 family phage major capsid protein